MATLLAKFKLNPTTRHRANLACYIQRHPMAVCMLAPADIALLRAEGLL